MMAATPTRLAAKKALAKRDEEDARTIGELFFLTVSEVAPHHTPHTVTDYLRKNFPKVAGES